MARAATLSGIDPDDEDYEEAAQMFEDDLSDDRSLSTRAKLAMKKLVQRVGFFGILLCASVSLCSFFLIYFHSFPAVQLVFSEFFCKIHFIKQFLF